MRKQIYDNQEATGLRASLTAFFLSLYPRPHRFLTLFFFFFSPSVPQSEFRFSNKRPRFTTFRELLSGLPSEKNTLSFPAHIFFLNFSLSPPFCSLYTCYFLFDFFSRAGRVFYCPSYVPRGRQSDNVLLLREMDSHTYRNAHLRTTTSSRL